MNENLNTNGDQLGGKNFPWAFNHMEKGGRVTRLAWPNSISVFIQRPDEHSKMTKPYLVMKKGGDMFPLDMSCESIFAKDWIEVQ